MHGVLPVPESHDFMFRRLGYDLQLVWQGFPTHDQGMVSSCFKWDWQPAKYPVSFVQNGRGLPMHDTIRADYLSSINLTYALMPKANA